MASADRVAWCVPGLLTATVLDPPRNPIGAADKNLILGWGAVVVGRPFLEAVPVVVIALYPSPRGGFEARSVNRLRSTVAAIQCA